MSMKIILSVILTLMFTVSSFSSGTAFPALEKIKILNRDIAGTVTDQNNKFIAGLRVRVINTATKKQYKTKTNKSGFFKFTDLPLGTYTIKFEGRKNFLPKTAERIEVGLNGGVMYNTSLEEK